MLARNGNVPKIIDYQQPIIAIKTSLWRNTTPPTSKRTHTVLLLLFSIQGFAQTECIPCLIGTFGSESGADTCEVCPQGTFQDQVRVNRSGRRSLFWIELLPVAQMKTAWAMRRMPSQCHAKQSVLVNMEDSFVWDRGKANEHRLHLPTCCSKCVWLRISVQE